MIPQLQTEPRRGVRFNRTAERERDRITRLINRLTQYRALATRHDKLAADDRPFLVIARIWH